MIRLRFAWWLAACGLLFTTSASAQATETLRRVVISKSVFGRPIMRMPISLDDSPGHTLTQSYRIDDVTSSDPSVLNAVQEHVYIQSEDRDGARIFKTGYSFFVTPEGDSIHTLGWG
jgi:hypothetical protein